jgi:two-component system OmpR family sensor kinase
VNGLRSIRSELLKWTLGALCLGSIVLVLVAYVVSLREMNEVLDENLRDVAGALDDYHRQSSGPAATAPGPSRPLDDGHDYGDLVTQISRADGSRVFSSNPQLSLPVVRKEGQDTVSIDGAEWRVYTRLSDIGIVQVAQRTVARREMASEAASRLVVPLVLLTLLIGGLLVFALRRGMAPLDETARQMSARTASSLRPLDEQEVPREMQPLVVAFNDLMTRLESSFALQRDFVADAAHELRTPVAALSLQIQLLERAQDDSARAQAIRDLRGGMNRTSRLVEQLLQLSRSQPDMEIFQLQQVALDGVARSVVGDFSRLAESAGVDVGVCADQPVSARLDPDQIRVLLNNLVRNALQFAPAGSRVDVSVGITRGRPWVRVADQGPGIAPEERVRVFDRFYRSTATTASNESALVGGSGLGLAIVKTIADRHRADVALDVGPMGLGLMVTVVFPKMPSA